MLCVRRGELREGVELNVGAMRGNVSCKDI